MKLVNTRLWKMLGALMGVAICAALIWGVDSDKKTSFYKNQGKVFGTYYSIQYEATNDLEDSIQAAFVAFDNSLSMFNPQSTLSAINNNRDTTTDEYFETMWTEAKHVYEQSGGAFDITVAPLVNLWGFGLKNRGNVNDAQVDSLLPLVGFDKVQLVDHKVQKADPRMMLDCGAVAKGQACDVVAEMLQRNGCKNYLVEIGGEIVARGNNSKGEAWHIGITKPNNNNEGAQNELQEVLAVSDICMATSGNYRNYYYDGDEKRSHTIDPRSGRPVQHALLSATVVSSSCMRADGLATACMVLGEQEALRMISKSEEDACYLIVAKNDSLVVMTSPNWEKMLKQQ